MIAFNKMLTSSLIFPNTKWAHEMYSQKEFFNFGNFFITPTLYFS